MLAAILKEGNDSLIVEEVALPEVNDGDVLVKVKACGVCHTDLHYIDHGVATFKKLPIILGHEASGVIEKVGENVINFAYGDRVVIPAVLTCGKCKSCLNNRENICANMKMLGNHINGAYAEYVSVPAKDIKKLPDDLSFEEGALVADALSTAYHAVFNRTNIKDNDYVMIIGCGGVGSCILQMVKIITDNIIAVDIVDSKLDLAEKQGAKYVINSSKLIIKEELKKLGIDNINTIFEVVGDKQNIETIFRLARPGTTICVVGYSNDDILISASKLMFFEIDLKGSLGCKPSDFEKVFELIHSKTIDVTKLISNRYKLEDINNALNDLRYSRGIRPVIIF